MTKLTQADKELIRRMHRENPTMKLQSMVDWVRKTFDEEVSTATISRIINPPKKRLAVVDETIDQEMNDPSNVEVDNVSVHVGADIGDGVGVTAGSVLSYQELDSEHDAGDTGDYNADVPPSVLVVLERRLKVLEDAEMHPKLRRLRCKVQKLEQELVSEKGHRKSMEKEITGLQWQLNHVVKNYVELIQHLPPSATAIPATSATPATPARTTTSRFRSMDLSTRVPVRSTTVPPVAPTPPQKHTRKRNTAGGGKAPTKRAKHAGDTISPTEKRKQTPRGIRSSLPVESDEDGILQNLEDLRMNSRPSQLQTIVQHCKWSGDVSIEMSIELQEAQNADDG